MSSIRGTNKLRRTLRRAPDRISIGVKNAVEKGAEAVRQDAIARVQPASIKRSIDIKYGRDRLTAVVGPGASAAELAARKNKRAGGARSAFGAARRSSVRLSKAKSEELFQFFKAYWYEFGTKGVPSRNIPPQPARPFMRPAADVNRRYFTEESRRAITRALDDLRRGR
ncbi:MAG: hypothetical protein U5L06_00630 [Rhodovibrio sp.]|nr:hypothetical protein [Rhodovibrio sp.]